MLYGCSSALVFTCRISFVEAVFRLLFLGLVENLGHKNIAAGDKLQKASSTSKSLVDLVPGLQ